MRYIVITAKHHDGFAMFPSRASTFNIHDATPFPRDPLAELSAACRKEGVRFGLYYSQAMDWHNPGGQPPKKGWWDPAQHGDMMHYIQTTAAPQVREILSNYGTISELWFDMAVNMNSAMADQILCVVKATQPGVLINNRLGGGCNGDFNTPEQYIPSTGYPGRDWETCMTINDTWGFKNQDTNWKSAGDLIRKLIDICHKGGNFLLNVGPDARRHSAGVPSNGWRPSARGCRRTARPFTAPRPVRFPFSPGGAVRDTAMHSTFMCSTGRPTANCAFPCRPR